LTHVTEQATVLGLTTVKLTGGEPLIHPDIVAILEYLAKQQVRVVLETNGMNVTADVVSALRACHAPFVSVSLDGSDAAPHEWVRGVPGSFARTVKGAKTLAAAGLNPQIIMTVLRRNQDHMGRVVKLAESIGASSVKFNLVSPVARGAGVQGRAETPSVQELIELGKWVERDLAAASSVPVFYDQPPAFRSLGLMFGPFSHGCGRCPVLNIIGVLPDGSYALCGIGTTVPELVFGQAGIDTLHNVWTNAAPLKELRRGMPHKLEGVCADCLMRDMCRARCIAVNFHQTKSLWKSHWFCEQARAAGVFPQSRLATAAQVVA
jgi:SynChlorMet cassette radical SAM/SPASM protein ScmF